MTGAPPTATVDGGAPPLNLDVINWRYEELERAGYPTIAAIFLAERGDVDLHVACELLANGASAEQAIRILV